MISALLFAVPPETKEILNSTSLSISPSVMAAQTSLNTTLSSGVVYSLAVKAIAIPVCGMNMIYYLVYTPIVSTCEGDSV